MTPERKLWLDNLKVGDEVCIDGYTVSDDYKLISVITEITPNRKFRVKNTLFNEDGEYRQGWNRSSIIEATTEIRQEIKNTNRMIYVSRISRIDWEQVPQKKIDKIYEILKS